MNNWNCNNDTSSNNVYIGRMPALSPYTSDCYFSPSLQSQVDLLDTRGYSREDCSSACSSSVSDISELECQTFTDSMIYGGIISAASTVDPSLFATRQRIYSQQSLTPLLIQPETQQEKVLSHSFYRSQNNYQAVNTTDVSYALQPATSYYISPIMSTENAFETSFGFYPYASSNMRTTSNDHSITAPPCYNQQYVQQTNYSSSKRVKYEQQEANFLPSKQQANNHHMTNKMNSSNHIFPCAEHNCNKFFTRPYNLKSHMRTHTHERPYGCHYNPCGWKFARPHDLKRHELQHSGLKPHGCKFCHRSFARSDALKRHLKIDATCSQALNQDLLLHGGKESSSSLNKKKRSSTTTKQ